MRIKSNAASSYSYSRFVICLLVIILLSLSICTCTVSATDTVGTTEQVVKFNAYRDCPVCVRVLASVKEMSRSQALPISVAFDKYCDLDENESTLQVSESKFCYDTANMKGAIHRILQLGAGGERACKKVHDANPNFCRKTETGTVRIGMSTGAGTRSNDDASASDSGTTGTGSDSTAEGVGVGDTKKQQQSVVVGVDDNGDTIASGSSVADADKDPDRKNYSGNGNGSVNGSTEVGVETGNEGRDNSITANIAAGTDTTGDATVVLPVHTPEPVPHTHKTKRILGVIYE